MDDSSSLDPDYFHFKQFKVRNTSAALKVNFDGVLLGAWVDVNNQKRVLDAGTGSGVIALMLNQKNPHCFIDAIDIDKESISEARFNVKLNEKQDMINVSRIAIQENNPSYQYDHIVSNLPFFQNDTLASTSAKQISKHATQFKIADLINASQRLLKREAFLSLILPFEEAQDFKFSARKSNLHLVRQLTTKSRKGKPSKRVLMTFVNSDMVPYRVDKQEVYVHEEGRDNYSEAYKEIVGEFYLDM